MSWILKFRKEKSFFGLERIIFSNKKKNYPDDSLEISDELKTNLGQIRSQLAHEGRRAEFLLEQANSLKQKPADYRNKKGRVSSKEYSSTYNSIKSASEKASDSENRLIKIALDYSRIKKGLTKPEDEQALAIRNEIKGKLVSAHKNLVQSKELIESAGHDFFNKNYDLIKENGYELQLQRKKGKAFRPAAIAALSLFLGGAGIAGLYKANIIQLPKQNPGIEQTIEQEPGIDAYERMGASSFLRNENSVLVSGKIPILMYHKIGTPEDRFTVSPENFKRHLQKLYDNNFQLISLEEYVNNDFSSLKPGKKPAIITFDDADQGQFEIAKYKGKLVYDEFSNPVIDPDCSVGIITDFYKQNPEFGKSASYFIDFVDKDHKEQAPFMQEELVKLKLNYLLKEGFEVCKHTYSHPDMKRCSLEDVKRDEARFDTAIEYYIGEKSGLVKDILAFPYGSVPENKEVVNYINKKYRTFTAWGGAADMYAHSSGASEKYSPPRIEISTNLDKDVLSKGNVLYKTKRGGE